MKDDNVIILDFLEKGKGSSFKSEPIAQVLGTRFFSLLEIVPKRDIILKQGEQVYIGTQERDKIDHIKRRITTKDLTSFAKSELPYVIEKIVVENEERFVSFFNNAQPISTRVHQLELLHGIGKKHMWDIINERKKGEFKNFKDLQDKIKLLPDPKEMIVKRIMQELENENERFRLFVIGQSQNRF